MQFRIYESFFKQLFAKYTRGTGITVAYLDQDQLWFVQRSLVAGSGGCTCNVTCDLKPIAIQCNNPRGDWSICFRGRPLLERVYN